MPAAALDAGLAASRGRLSLRHSRRAVASGRARRGVRRRTAGEGRSRPAAGAVQEVSGPGTFLPPGPYRGEFAEVLLARRTWRGFGRAAIRRRQLGSLLDLTFGAQMAGTTGAGNEVLFKTSPSAGACHPIEGYVLVLRVAGITPGFYHYSPRTSSLHLVRKGATSRQAVTCLAGQSWYAGAAAVVFLTAVLPRLWWRYRPSPSLSSRALGSRTRLPDLLPCRDVAGPCAVLHDGARGCPHRADSAGGRRRRDSLVRRRRRFPAEGRTLGAVAREYARHRQAGSTTKDWLA